MSPLARLAKELMLGTERCAPALVDLPPPIQDLVDTARAPDTAVEAHVLRCAGVLAACGASGYVPPGARAALPPPCPAETRPSVESAKLISVLQQIIGSGPDALREEAAQLLAGAGYVLPSRCLPAVLTLGQKFASLRPAFLPVLGVRGDWLAQQQQGWEWAVGAQAPEADPALWEDGSLEQRRQYLTTLRRRDPAAARVLFQTDAVQFDLRERVAFLGVLHEGLSVDDEDFLETLLTDRSKEVRQLVARLLSGIPESRFVARMAERMQQCLSRQRKLLRQVWTLEAPEQFGRDWKADALEESRAKSESLGERAWWLYQIARALPLSWWAGYVGMSPQELIKWVQGTDWRDAMLRGWGEAMQRDENADWAEAFLAAPTIKGLTLDEYALIDCLPWARRESAWLGMVESGGHHFSLGDVLLRVMASPRPHGQFFSAGFAQSVLRKERKILLTGAGKYDYNLRRALPEFICLIPSSCLDEAAGNWPMGQPEAGYFDEAMAAMLAIIEQRKILHSTLCQRKS